MGEYVPLTPTQQQREDACDRLREAVYALMGIGEDAGGVRDVVAEAIADYEHKDE